MYWVNLLRSTLFSTSRVEKRGVNRMALGSLAYKVLGNHSLVNRELMVQSRALREWSQLRSDKPAGRPGQKRAGVEQCAFHFFRELRGNVVRHW